MKLSKGKIKLIKALQLKKFRKKYNLFIVEGIKNVNELINSDFQIEEIITTKQNLNKLNIPQNPNFDIITTNENIFTEISSQKTPQNIIAIAKIKKWDITPQQTKNKLIIALDNIQDPGNLGTIIRTADWFAVDFIICSNNTVDAFNPKVVQASMGAIFHVPITYKNLYQFLKEAKNFTNIIATTLNGNNLFTSKLPKSAIIILGNEAHGINPILTNLAHLKITIPSFNPKPHVQSLNVAMATTIIISEFKRRTYLK